MNYLSLENVSKSYGDKVLFRDISMQISHGQKIALVAKNGTGKTTLLRVIAGLEPGEGEGHSILLKRDIRVGYLEQEPSFLETHTVMEAVFDSDNPILKAIRNYEQAMLFPDRSAAFQKAINRMDELNAWDFEAKINEILSKLNILLDQEIATLSGGQRKRLALAKILIEDPEFLILDEPTNHLDLDMIEWLEQYLQQPNLTIFMVTHDRYFLERVCDTIVELTDGNLYKYRGNYSDFLIKKTAREDNEAANLQKVKRLFKRELEWVRRMPKARGTKAKARVDAFEEIKTKASKRLDDGQVQLEIKGQRLGSKILEVQYISKSYGDLKLIDNFAYKFKKKERVGIVGPNGAGKSTLLRLLTQAERPDSGKIIVGETVVFGYYSQEGIQLKEDKRVIDVVQDVAEYIPLAKGQKLTAIQLLDRFLFTRDQHQLYVSQLSGGERRRLYLLTVLMENPNFLILDEPTNDLDIITLNILEDFLMEFPGCVVIVSHDRYFMDKLVDHLFVFEGAGKIKDYNGNYTEYRALQKQKELETRRQESAANNNKKEKTLQDTDLQISREERKELKRLEKEIMKLEDRKSAIMNRFSTGDLPPGEVEKLSIELAGLNSSIEEKEMRWMELADKMN